MRGESQKMPVTSRLGLSSPLCQDSHWERFKSTGPANKVLWLPPALTFVKSAAWTHFTFKSLKIRTWNCRWSTMNPRACGECAVIEYLGHVPCNLTSFSSRRHTASGPLCIAVSLWCNVLSQPVNQFPLGKEKKKNQRTLCDELDIPLLKSLILQYLNTFSAKMVK